jgi:hypothetical protein
MSNRKIWMCFISILATFNLYGQENVYIGMTADEFKTKLPGMLPNETKYNGDLYLKEKLHDIDGRWTFVFSGNDLVSAGFLGESKIKNEADFNNWINSAGSIIDDYIKIYGQPLKYEKGASKYLDRDNIEYEKTIGKREVFHEAFWETKTMRIRISCDYRSNYFEEFREDLPNGPPQWFNYAFQIKYSSVPANRDVKADDVGRFYLGMDVKSFAKVFPELFPKGIGMSGQWHREQELYGISGSWSYTFENDKLTWMHFNRYIDEINEANFNKCLSATKQLIKDYSGSYGIPDTTMIGDTTFLDPIKKRHWGYDVIEARWKDYRGMKIKIEFTFMGGKGDYHFLVEINYFDKSYPYYE